jgi:hypothetical protein
VKYGWVLFFNPICYSVSLDWGIEAISFSVGTEKCVLFPVIFVSPLFSFTYSLFTGLLAQKGLFFLESTCLTLVSSSVCKSPLSIFCSAGLWSQIPLVISCERFKFLLQLGRIVLLDRVVWVDSCFLLRPGLCLSMTFIHLELS